MQICWIYISLLPFIVYINATPEWSAAISISLKRNFDTLLYYTINHMNNTQFNLREYGIATPASRDRIILKEYCGLLPDIDPDICELCTAILQHNYILRSARDYDLDIIDQTTVEYASDMTVKYLAFAYDGIRKSYFAEDVTRTVCIFGKFSSQVLRGIAALHRGLQFKLKYFVFDEGYDYNEQSYNWYILLTNARVEFQYASIHMYRFQQISEIHPDTITDCDIIHWREFTSQRNHQSYNSVDEEDVEDSNMKQMTILSQQMKRSSVAGKSIPIVYEHFTYSSHIQWTNPIIVQNQESQQEQTGNKKLKEQYLQWFAVGKGFDGILVPVFIHDVTTTCGNLIFPMHLYNQLNGRVIELFVGELSPFITHAYQLSASWQSLHTPSSTSTLSPTPSPTTPPTTPSSTSLSTLSTWCSHFVFFISYDVNFYIETAYGLQYALQSIGCSNVKIMGFFDYALYQTYLTEQEEDQQVAYPLIQITLGPHRPTMLTEYYLVFHTENTWDSFLHDAKYQYIVKHAWGILVYSTANIPYLHSIGRYHRVHTIPMYTTTIYYEIQPQCITTTTSAAGAAAASSCAIEKESTWDIVIAERVDRAARDKKVTVRNTFSSKEKSPPRDEYRYPTTANTVTYDISLIGSSSERRNTLSNQLIQQNEDNARTQNRHPYSFLISHSHADFDSFDVYTREFMIVHSTIILNIHQFEASILETHRINHMLSLGKVIISERSVLDPSLDAYYEDTILFTEAENMFDLAKQLLENDEERKRLEKRSYQKYLQIMQNTSQLAVAFASLLSPFQLKL